MDCGAGSCLGAVCGTACWVSGGSSPAPYWALPAMETGVWTSWDGDDGNSNGCLLPGGVDVVAVASCAPLAPNSAVD